MKTRFAPSPTGFLHLGVLRTALFNYLLAKHHKGSFVVRIEDTDKERSKKIYEEDIFNSLKKLGITWDERYRQSERKEIYKEYLEKLINNNNAYYCFCSKEELEAKRDSQITSGFPPKYDGECSRLKKEEVEERIRRGDKSVIRLKVPEKKIEIKDMIRGKISFDTGLIGDIVIAKDMETPLYNLSVVIDDYEMGITHVIRGEDILPNTPKQVIISEYLNIPLPFYGHLPMILGEDRSKLSKRHGAKSVTEIMKEGYLKEAIINFIAFLGWNPGDEREIFTIDELIEEFEVKDINKSGAVFNLEKLNHINGLYIRKKSIEEITEKSIPYLIERGYILPIFVNEEIVPNLTGIIGREIKNYFLIKEIGEKVSFDYLKKVVSLYKKRMKKLSEIGDFTDYIFLKDILLDKELLRWKDMDDKEISLVLNKLLEMVKEIKNWDKENIEKEGMNLANSYREGDRGRILWPFRASLTGKRSSAGPFEIAEVLGKRRTIERIEKALTLF